MNDFSCFYLKHVLPCTSNLLVRDGAYRNTLIRSFPHIHHILEAESALDFNLSVKRPESTGCVGNARGIQCGQGNLVREQHVFRSMEASTCSCHRFISAVSAAAKEKPSGYPESGRTPGFQQCTFRKMRALEVAGPKQGKSSFNSQVLSEHGSHFARCFPFTVAVVIIQKWL